MAYTPRAEIISGSDLSGSSGDANRTYTLTNSNAVLAQMQIIRDSAILQSGTDFTFNATTNTITIISNTWDDMAIAIDYLTDDSASSLVYTPLEYTIQGFDLSGSSGATGRIFQFLINDILGEQVQIVMNSSALQNGTDFTINTTTKAITFLTAVTDSDSIVIDFYVLGDSYYATSLQVARFSGTGVSVELESLGTGTNTLRSFDTDNPNIVDSSYTVYYGATGDGSNRLQIMVQGTDYLIALDDGRVYLLKAGLTKLGTDELYISYTYSPKQSDTVLKSYLPSATKEAEKITGNYWGALKTSVELFDGYDSGYPQTDLPFGNQIDQLPEFELRNKGISSITSVIFLDKQGNTDSTLETTSYRVITNDDMHDSRLMLNIAVPNGRANVQVTYIHGYSTVPELVQELTGLIAGMMALVNISGGSYKDISTYQLGRKSFSIGQVYVNIESSIKQMNTRIQAISEILGERFSCV